MDEGLKKVELSGFVSSAANAPVRALRSRSGSYAKRANSRGGAQRKRQPQPQPVDATSMLIKCGICAAACALVLLFKWIGAPQTEAALQTVKQAVTDEDELDEMLGKLKFVELPGILEVFSSAGKLQPPIEAAQSEVLADNTMLALTAAQGQSVGACLEGSVKEVGIDKDYGNYVRIVGADDRDLYLFGLSGTSVEVGQPLLSSDYIGSINAGGKLYVRLLIKGKPENPAAYFIAQAGSV